MLVFHVISRKLTCKKNYIDRVVVAEIWGYMFLGGGLEVPLEKLVFKEIEQAIF